MAINTPCRDQPELQHRTDPRTVSRDTAVDDHRGPVVRQEGLGEEPTSKGLGREGL